MATVTLRVRNDNFWFEPIVLDDITWETSRKESPSKLTFTVVKDDLVGFNEGSEVRLLIDGKDVFFGYVFEKTRNKNHHIEVLAYDQLRYLQNKATYRIYGVRADQLISCIAKDFRLKTGSLVNTGCVIPIVDEQDVSLFDIVQNAIDETVRLTGKLYYLYDDCGYLTLKNIKDSIVPLLVDKDTAEDFDYKTSIDSETYNRIVIAEDSDGKQKGVYTEVTDMKSVGQWGVLQYFESGYKGKNPLNKAKTLLKLHNHVTRSLTINDCLGDIRVRAGTSVYVDLSLGDKTLDNQLLLVEKATHKFKEGHHSMDLSVIGHREFYGE